MHLLGTVIVLIEYMKSNKEQTNYKLESRPLAVFCWPIQLTCRIELLRGAGQAV